MENIKLIINENPEEENIGFLDKIKNYYEKNKKELWVVFGLLVLINLINPTFKIYKQYGGQVENLITSAGVAPHAPEVPHTPATTALEKAPKVAKVPGGDKKSKFAFLKNIKGGIKGNNFFTTILSWMFSLVQSLITFAFLIIVLAVLPGLPIFIFMFILFFILRARMASIKSL